MNIPEAFRATQGDFKQNPLGTPYQWAGFVLVEQDLYTIDYQILMAKNSSSIFYGVSYSVSN